MQVVIVGAGFAGVSTAYHLALLGAKGILVLEQEKGPGMFASGRNAGLLRQSSHDEVIANLLREGQREALRILAAIPGALQHSGSLILGDGVRSLRPGPQARLRDASEVVPGLEGEALHDPEDSISDPLALLGAMVDGARARGVEFSFGEEVRAVETRQRTVQAVVTDRRTLPADVLVVAAGAWAGSVAAMAGSDAVAIEPRRRHLFRGKLARPDAAALPFVWHESAGVYFRPEGDGVLLSGCDQTPHPAEAPAVDPVQADLLAEKLEATFGTLGEWSIGPGWACLRTFAPDERFLIGPDPRVSGLFWVAGLGGHGMTASWAVGRLAAQVLLGQADAGALDPRRFA